MSTLSQQNFPKSKMPPPIDNENQSQVEMATEAEPRPKQEKPEISKLIENFNRLLHQDETETLAMLQKTTAALPEAFPRRIHSLQLSKGLWTPKKGMNQIEKENQYLNEYNSYLEGTAERRWNLLDAVKEIEKREKGELERELKAMEQVLEKKNKSDEELKNALLSHCQVIEKMVKDAGSTLPPLQGVVDLVKAEIEDMRQTIRKDRTGE